MNKLRLLGFDDLFLLRLLLDGDTITATAARLGLTQPAVTQRLRKIERIFALALTQKVGRRVRLTDPGRALANRAAAALALMGEAAEGPGATTLTLGTRPEVGRSWLWPALAELRPARPNLVVHLHCGSGDEILRMLGTGNLDAVLTSAPHMVKGFGALELAEEHYVLAAAPALARRIRRIEDLRDHVLVEHDRSFPFLRYLAAEDRARLKYKDVWFLGSSVTMTEALVAGLGVGIVPLYLARPWIQKKRLRKVLPGIPIASDRFRLVYRLDRGLDEPMAGLAAALRATGLR